MSKCVEVRLQRISSTARGWGGNKLFCLWEWRHARNANTQADHQNDKHAAEFLRGCAPAPPPRRQGRQWRAAAPRLTSDSGWLRVTVKGCPLSWPRMWLFRLYWLLNVFSQPSLGQLNGFSPAGRAEREREQRSIVKQWAEFQCDGKILVCCIKHSKLLYGILIQGNTKTWSLCSDGRTFKSGLQRCKLELAGRQTTLFKGHAAHTVSDLYFRYLGNKLTRLIVKINQIDLQSAANLAPCLQHPREMLSNSFAGSETRVDVRKPWQSTFYNNNNNNKEWMMH